MRLTTYLTGLLILCGFFVFQLQSQEKPADPDPQRFAKEIDRFIQFDRQNAVPKDGVLFIGSSSIRMWMTQESFPDLPVINRGFGGAHISDVNHFAEKIVLPYQAKIMAFYAGDNDVAAGKSAERVFSDYKKFLEVVWQKRGDTQIIFVPIKPSLARWSKWPEMAKANKMIASYSEKDDRLHYADVATPMLGENGKPTGDLFIDDGLHLNEKGYALWTKALSPFIKKALKKK